jgi:hypothetical protein
MKYDRHIIPATAADNNKRLTPKVVLHHGGRFSVRLNKHWQRQLDRLELPIYRTLSAKVRRKLMRHLVRHHVVV